MIFEGQAIQVKRLQGDLVNLIFDREGERVNTLSRATIEELTQALTAIEASPNVKGLMISSAKDDFIVGADINEFHGVFNDSEEAIAEMCLGVHSIFNQIEDLPYPTVTAINGLALGGGCEISLATDFRILSTKGKIGLPETQLGILPGWGGCVRLPRLIGADNAIEWIAAGSQNRADKALKVGVADAVVEPENLETAAIKCLEEAISGKLDWQARKEIKKQLLSCFSSTQSFRLNELVDSLKHSTTDSDKVVTVVRSLIQKEVLDLENDTITLRNKN